MKFRIGYELQYEFPRPTPVIANLNVHFTRVSDLATAKPTLQNRPCSLRAQ